MPKPRVLIKVKVLHTKRRTLTQKPDHSKWFIDQSDDETQNRTEKSQHRDEIKIKVVNDIKAAMQTENWN